MAAIGIVILLLGYAVVYSGVEEVKTGMSVKALDTLKPGFTPPPEAKQKQGGGRAPALPIPGVPGPVKQGAGGVLNWLYEHLTGIGISIDDNKKKQGK